MARTVPAQTITIYTSENDKGEPQVAIRFTTAEEKNAFIGGMIAEGDRVGQDLRILFVNYDPAVSKIFINPSKHGGPGAIAEYGELSVNFGNEAIRDKFQFLLGLTEVHARAGRFDATIKFNKELLTSEPDPNGRRNIEIGK